MNLNASLRLKKRARNISIKQDGPRDLSVRHCGHRKFWSSKTDRYRCSHCEYRISVKAGTIFQDSRIPLRLWLRAIWQVVSQKNGISALGLKRVLGLKSYQTTWLMMHKLRKAMAPRVLVVSSWLVLFKLMKPVLEDLALVNGAEAPLEKRWFLLWLRLKISSPDEFVCIKSKMPREPV